MYDFVDTTGRQPAPDLPAEALKINGQYIEDRVQGYRTLYVRGRELLAKELATVEVGSADGSFKSYRRHPARTITVGYQLIAEDSAAFRKAYNDLNGVLNVEDAELIFQDEPDKYFIGTPSDMEDVEPGLNAVTSEFSIFCADPCKYSTEMYEAEPDYDGGKTFIINYRGTYRSYPTLEVRFFDEDESGAGKLTGAGDCGYAAFFNDRGKIIQLGDPEEVDEETQAASSQTLMSHNWQKSTAWDSAEQALWTVNGVKVYGDESGIKPDGVMIHGHAFATQEEGTYFLYSGGYGSGDKWHGPFMSRRLPADASGHVGAKNFTLSYMQKISIGNGKADTNQLGAFYMRLSSGEGEGRKPVVRFSVFKNAAGKQALFICELGSRIVSKETKDLSYDNKYFGNNTSKATTVKASTITKEGAKVTFNMGGYQKVFTDNAIAETEVTEVSFGFLKWSTVTPLSFNGIYSLKFVKNNCETKKDVPNKFSANDIVTADCRTGEILLNGTEAPELGALGNDWEEFYLKNGANQIGVSYSDWVSSDNAPAFKLRYREVYL